MNRELFVVTETLTVLFGKSTVRQSTCSVTFFCAVHVSPWKTGHKYHPGPGVSLAGRTVRGALFFS